MLFLWGEWIDGNQRLFHDRKVSNNSLWVMRVLGLRFNLKISLM